MSFWTFVFLCVIAGIGYDIWSRKNFPDGPGLFDRFQDFHQGHRRRKFDPPARNLDTPARERELEGEIEALRERIKVLERIVTDDHGSRDLAREIDKLRDG